MYVLAVDRVGHGRSAAEIWGELAHGLTSPHSSTSASASTCRTCQVDVDGAWPWLSSDLLKGCSSAP